MNENNNNNNNNIVSNEIELNYDIEDNNTNNNNNTLPIGVPFTDEDAYDPIVFAPEEMTIFKIKVKWMTYVYWKLFLNIFAPISSINAGASIGTIQGNRLVFWSIIYIIWGWILTPLYQNWILLNKKNEKIHCYSCWTLNCYYYLIGKYHFIPKIDEGRKCTRFIPFSIYNWIYAYQNPGKRLNPTLPKYINKIGAFRAMLIWGLVLLQGLLIIFDWVVSIQEFKQQSSAYGTTSAFFAILIATLDLPKTLIAWLFWYITIPWLFFASTCLISCILPRICCARIVEARKPGCYYTTFLWSWKYAFDE